MMARYLKNKKNVRILSLGTGRDKEKMKKSLEEQDSFNKFNNIVSTQFLKFLTDFEQTTATHLVK